VRGVIQYQVSGAERRHIDALVLAAEHARSTGWSVAAYAALEAELALDHGEIVRISAEQETAWHRKAVAVG
jgi:hypothetical protein